MENLDKLVNELRKLPTETQWLEFKHNNYTPDMIGKDITPLPTVLLFTKKVAPICFGELMTKHTKLLEQIMTSRP